MTYMMRLQDERMEGRAEGIVIGEKKGALKTLLDLVKDGVLSVSDAAKRANMSQSDFEKEYQAFSLQ